MNGEEAISGQYYCAQCGKMHHGWPALTYNTPHSYDTLNEDEKKRYVRELNEDFCVLEYEDQTDRFIRVILIQEVIDTCQDLHYGVWVSLSEKSYDDYNDKFLSDKQEGTYFGYLSSRILGYDASILGVKTNVVLADGRQRPEIIPHADQMDIDFVRDYYNGITIAEAEKRINDFTNLISGKTAKPSIFKRLLSLLKPD